MKLLKLTYFSKLESCAKRKILFYKDLEKFPFIKWKIFILRDFKILIRF